MLNDVKIGLFITGGIASYKMAELSRQLIKRGADVKVAMTDGAQEFITPLTLQTLTKHAVLTNTFDEHDPRSIQHIGMADWLDIALIAPATANIIGKMANGIADDAVSSTLMAVDRPRLIVPAMNTKMYENPATQANLKKLASYGFKVLEPDTGFLAEGYSGKGRLPELERIVDEVEQLYNQKNRSQLLEGRKVIVTAGGTKERLDPVRYLSNDSSGQMGYAMAQAAKYYGASEVHLISTRDNLKVPLGVDVTYVESAQEMYEEVHKYYPETDFVVMAAAVGDFRAAQASDQKVKKQDQADSTYTIKLVENPDILASLGQAKDNQILIGFAAETQNVTQYAQEKLDRKNADWIVANDVSKEGIGFNSSHNEVILLGRDGTYEELPYQSKENVALLLWKNILEPKHNA